MSFKEVRPSLDPETCVVCGRRLLQGERLNWYVAPDASRRPVCELCAPRAERARWVREQDGEEIVPLLPSRTARGGYFKRLKSFFGTQEEDELQLESFDTAPGSPSDQESRRRSRATRRRERDAIASSPPPAAPAEPRSVRAVPTGPEAKLQQGLTLFNDSQFPRTIAGLSRSLGEPCVAAVNEGDASVEVFVGWDIAWYSYRVDLGDATEPVEQSGRGNDTAELAGTVRDWNAFADEHGRLHLRAPGETAPTPPTAEEPVPPGSDGGTGFDGSTVYGDGS